MRVRQAVVVSVLLVIGGMLVALPALGIGMGSQPTAEDVAQNETDSDTLGTQISSFAQSSAVDVNASIEAGMWEASVNSSEEPEREIENRTAELERRLQRLENRSAELQAMRDNGTISEHIYEARASATLAQIAQTNSAINHTEETADQWGVAVNQTKLDHLRNEASNMTGPEVSEIARNITDAPQGPPDERGPPDHAGPGENETDPGPPDDAGPGENETDPGPPEDAGPGGNETDPGPPEDAGPGENETDPGPPEDPGQGEDGGDGGPPEDPGQDANETEPGQPDEAGTEGNGTSSGASDDGGDAGPPDGAGQGNGNDGDDNGATPEEPASESETDD